MINALAILGEIEARIEGHRQLDTEEGRHNSARNAIIVALNDLKEWLIKEIDKDLLRLEELLDIQHGKLNKSTSSKA